MIRLITYSDENMTISAKKCVDSAIKYGGVTEALRYTPDHISHEFKEFNKDIFIPGARGAGCFWLFKPYIIYREMLSMTDGDILIYSDAGIEFIDSFRHIIDRMKDDFFFFSNGWRHVEWCKYSSCCLINAEVSYGITVDGSNQVSSFSGEYEHAEQIQASLLFFRVSNKTKAFVKEWLMFCQMPGLIDDSPSVKANFPTFADHRHDQAILTCVALRWDINYKNLWPDRIWQNQRHRWPHSDYPAILVHHRRRNNEY